MSRSSRDFYSSSNDRSHHRPLPPIRDVVGDVLDQPVRPRSGTPDIYRSRQYTNTTQSASMQLPPIHSERSISSSQSQYAPRSLYSARSQETSRHSYEQPMRQELTSPGHSQYAARSPYSSRNYETYSPSPRSSHQDWMGQEHTPRRGTTSAHSYDVFVSSSSQGLVHKRSSSKDDFHQVAKEEIISSSTGRNVCSECGRRFEKLSTLKNHMTTHSGEKPYDCPDCGKSFSVQSNMKRHQLTHRPTSSSRGL